MPEVEKESGRIQILVLEAVTVNNTVAILWV